MKILDIYKKYYTHTNLQYHMQRVATVGLYIYDHWVGQQIDKTLLTKVCLVHDLGNIVRIDIQKYPQFLTEEDRKNIPFWENAQKEMIEKYGKEDHAATAKMMDELGLDQSLITMVNEMSFNNITEIVSSVKIYPKLLLYADLRVNPMGIVSMKERLDEVLARRIKYTPEYKKIIYAVAMDLEQQIKQNLNVAVDTITNESVSKYREQLLNFEI